MENKNAEVTLTGRWRLARKFSTPDGIRECNVNVFRGQDYIVGFPKEGIITERCGGEVTTTMCHYDPATRILDIQPTRRLLPSPISDSDTPLRIIPLNNGEMYFMRPHSVLAGDENSDFEAILLQRL